MNADMLNKLKRLAIVLAVVLFLCLALLSFCWSTSIFLGAASRASSCFTRLSISS